MNKASAHVQLEPQHSIVEHQIAQEVIFHGVVEAGQEYVVYSLPGLQMIEVQGNRLIKQANPEFWGISQVEVVFIFRNPILVGYLGFLYFVHLSQAYSQL